MWPKARVIEDHPARCLDIRVIAWFLNLVALRLDHLACHATGPAEGHRCSKITRIMPV
jgi:hypothetical protein